MMMCLRITRADCLIQSVGLKPTAISVGGPKAKKAFFFRSVPFHQVKGDY